MWKATITLIIALVVIPDMKGAAYAVLLLVLIVLVSGCLGLFSNSDEDAAVKEIQAALDAQELALENCQDLDFAFTDGEFVVTVGVPPRIEYASEKFTESAEHAVKAQQYLTSARDKADNSDEVMKYGQYYEAALFIESVANYGIDLTTELQQPAPNGTLCLANMKTMGSLLEYQNSALQRIG